MACKPGSVRSREAGDMPGLHPASFRPPRLLDGHSSGMPVTGHLARPTRGSARKGAWTGCPAPVLLSGLAPGEVCPAAGVTVSAVRSYRTFSPLPAGTIAGRRRRYRLCGTVSGIAPAGRYPAPSFRGARTFLPCCPKAARAAIRPSGGWGV